MVPPVARLGTRWASRSTAPARGKQPGLSQGGPRRSQNRSPPAVTPLWLGRAGSQSTMRVCPRAPRSRQGPPPSVRELPRTLQSGRRSVRDVPAASPGAQSRRSARVAARSAPPPRRDRPDAPTHHVQIPKREPPWGESSSVNLSLSTVEWALSNGQSVTIIRGDSPKIAPKKAREARRRDSTAARPLEPKRLLELHCTSRSVEAARVRPFAPAIG